ncbi:MAG: hypothetical protein ACPG45_03440 [Flavobacteriaceae bacterium]
MKKIIIVVGALVLMSFNLPSTEIKCVTENEFNDCDLYCKGRADAKYGAKARGTAAWKRYQADCVKNPPTNCETISGTGIVPKPNDESLDPTAQ